MRHSVSDMSSYQTPERLLAQARNAWLKSQQAETEQPPGQFVLDMLHVLSLLNISTVEKKVCFRTKPVILVPHDVVCVYALIALNVSSSRARSGATCVWQLRN